MHNEGPLSFQSRRAAWPQAKLDDIHNFSAIGLQIEDIMEMFEDWLQISRRRSRNPIALGTLQSSNLLTQLLSSENMLRSYKAKKKHFRDKPESFTPEEHVPNLEAALELIEKQIYWNHRIRDAVKSIGDGILWRSLGFDRALIETLAEGEDPQLINTDGLLPELAEWSRFYDEGRGVSILASLTNYIRTCDLVLVSTDGTVELVEVKSSKGKKKSKQLRVLHDTADALQRRVKLREGREVRLLTLPIRPRHHLAQAEKALRSALTEGASSTLIGDHLILQSFNPAVIDEESMLTVFGEHKPILQAWHSQGDIVLPFEPHEHWRIRSAHAPWTVYPFPEELCISLAFDTLPVLAYLNLSEIQRQCTARGWDVIQRSLDSAESDTDEEEGMFTISSGGFHFVVPTRLAIRIVFELLLPDVICDIAENLKSIGAPDDPPQWAHISLDESQMWV